MSWVAAKPWKRPEPEPWVTILLNAPADGGAPKFSLFIPARAMAALGWMVGSRYALSVGAGEHKGWLRVAEDPAGAYLAAKVKGSASLTFGRIADVFDGCAGRARVRFTADQGVLEFAIPATHAFDAAKRAGRRPAAAKTAAGGAGGATTTPDRTVVVPRARGAENGTRDRDAGRKLNGERVAPVTVAGLVVDTTPDEETISHGGRTMDVTATQASLAYLLARAAPSPVGEDYLVRNVWGTDPNGPPKFKVALRDLGKALDGIGLGLKTIKGVGVQMTGLKVASRVGAES